MKKAIFTVLTLLLLHMNMFAAEVERVLIIGNSYTFCNNLPEVLMAVSRKTNHPLEVKSYTAGAMSLRGFLNTPAHTKARKMLESGSYDWVVLQDQSQTPAYKPDETLNAVRQWAEIAAASGTKVVLFLTWAHAYNDRGKLKLNADMQIKTGITYCRAAMVNKAKVAPVGEAWAAWYRKHPDTPLHVQDCSHPTPMGTYLAACVIHGTISGKAPKNIPAALRANKRTIISLPASSAAELQKAAAYTLKRFSPQKYLQQAEERDAELVSADEVKKETVKGTHISKLIKQVGKPFFKAAQDDRNIYCFHIRGGKELTAYCNSCGIIEQLSISAPDSMAEIIDLR